MTTPAAQPGAAAATARSWLATEELAGDGGAPAAAAMANVAGARGRGESKLEDEVGGLGLSWIGPILVLKLGH
ncbi:hypothetical protein PVL29_003844 [Vitis rotundifolia]|uniref:Uncharacterized protein n=1 Tax=Vitis rotundifolia TaxID=103349 RepID=A0AA39E2J6_VITRO|nr:hypothetical protein PVL29_003844 [Vitis rotundifolia]